VALQQSISVKRFNVFAAESTLSFFVKTNAGTVHGRTQSLEGFVEATWDDQGRLVTDPTPKMHVEFTVESLTSGLGLKDRDLWTMVDCTRFPKISGDLLRVVNTSGHINIATGRIAVGGVARSYEGSLLLKRGQGRVDIDGFITINIKDFGLKETRFLPFGMNTDVKVRLIIAAKL